MEAEHFTYLVEKCMNFLALSDSPLTTLGKANMKCNDCGVVIAEVTHVVTLMNGETLVPILNLKSLNEMAAALASHIVTKHSGIASEMVAKQREHES